MATLRMGSSLEKLMAGSAPQRELPLSVFQRERASWQVFYMGDPDTVWAERVFFTAEKPEGCRVRLRQVRTVPVRMATYPDSDEGYLSKAPGLYPDLLTDPQQGGLWARGDREESLWVDMTADRPGVYPVTVTMRNTQGEALAACTREVTVLPGELPPQTLMHTRWFYCDCLAEYYHVPVFSEAHWQIIERFMRCAVEHGINMLLTPIHTPPLDTRVGGERLTTQLVGIMKDADGYHFDMTLLRRWIALCKRCGVQYYEMAHLFTQWGAKHAPKIIATVDGAPRRLFGWETDAASAEYREFLAAYLPAIRAVLQEEGIANRTVWHISDEPNESNLDSYRAARHQVEDLLAGCRIMDALSSFSFYQQGVVEHPIVASNHLPPFLEAGVPDLWTYYCCAQYKDVSNMFIAMPSARNRALGVQLYLYRMEGFLQWGFNFYNAQYSDYSIDPYATTDADGWVPAGDPFQVYPGKDGIPEESIRLMVTDEALRDLRALTWLENLRGRAFTEHLIHEGLTEPITFTRYPLDDAYYLALREKVNRAIMAARQA